MNHGATGSAADAGDPLVRAMRVERVERADGRYFLYYSWPESAVEGRPDRTAHDPEPVDGDV